MSQPLTDDNPTAWPPDASTSGFRCALSYGSHASAWVRAAGELDIAAAHELEQMLRGAVVRARLLVLDLRDLTFIDSSGAHVIVDVSVRANRTPCRLVVIHGSPQVQRMFAITGLDRLFETVADPADIDGDPAPAQARLSSRQARNLTWPT